MSLFGFGKSKTAETDFVVARLKANVNTYAFLERDGEPDIFVPPAIAKSAGLKKLKAGTEIRVRFEIKPHRNDPGKSGPIATEVKVAGADTAE